MSQKKPVIDYLILFGVLVVALLLFMYFGFEPAFQQIIVLGAAVFYVGWGYVHHRLQGDYHSKVLAEYAAVAFFGAALLLVLLSRI